MMQMMFLTAECIYDVIKNNVSGNKVIQAKGVFFSEPVFHRVLILFISLGYCNLKECALAHL